MKNQLILKALGASSGKAQGKVRIIRKTAGANKFLKGEVLVTKMTDPAMVIIMAKAAAIITDTGGITCHAAIVSREMGIPCVVATQKATQILKNGQEVIVDGDKGEIYSVS